MDKPVHIRRCHICDGVTEINEGRVSDCNHCGQSLAPFYYFDDAFTKAPSENQAREAAPDGEYQPIFGLTVYWDSY